MLLPRSLTPNEPAAWKLGSGSWTAGAPVSSERQGCVLRHRDGVLGGGAAVGLGAGSAGDCAGDHDEACRLPGETNGDDIVIDREGKFAYATDRFDDIIVTFAISPSDGKLTLIEPDAMRREGSPPSCARPEWAVASGGEPGVGQYFGARS